MASYLVIIGRNSLNHVKCNYLKNEKKFVEILLRFGNLQNILTTFKKSDPHTINISEIIDSKKREYLKA